MLRLYRLGVLLVVLLLLLIYFLVPELLKPSSIICMYPCCPHPGISLAQDTV